MPKLLKNILLGITGLVFLLLAWGLSEPYFIDRQSYDVQINNLPPSWHDERVAVISDFQIGMWLDNIPTVRRTINQVVEEKPAAVIILGDFIYHGGPDASARIEEVAHLLQPLAASSIPVYAVLGNHDYSVVSSTDPRIDEERAAKLVEALASLGVQVLQNSAVPMEPPDGDENNEAPFYLVGLGAHMPGKDDPEAGFSAVPDNAARLVVMHNPSTFADIPAQQAPLAVAGHTHGGQMRIPFTPSWTWLTFLEEDEVHADGWIKNFGHPGNRLYVNRGIGFSKLPMRINCPPEITFFTLKQSEN